MWDVRHLINRHYDGIARHDALLRRGAHREQKPSVGIRTARYTQLNYKVDVISHELASFIRAPLMYLLERKLSALELGRGDTHTRTTHASNSPFLL